MPDQHIPNQQASDFNATQWKGFAAEYKAIQGPNFTRDSFYNGLWTKGARLDIAAGNTNQGIFDEMAGVAGAAGAPADVGLAIGRGIGQGIGNGLGSVMGMAGRSRNVVTPSIGARTGGFDPVTKGQAGEVLSEAEAVRAGETIKGRQVTFELPSGKRSRPDLLTELPDGGLKFREAKRLKRIVSDV